MGYLRYRAAKSLNLMAPAKPVLLELAQIAQDFHGDEWLKHGPGIRRPEGVQTSARECCRHAVLGLDARFVQNRTLSRKQSKIRGLRKRTFTQQFGPGLKTLAFLGAQTSCQIKLNGNRLMQQVLA